MTLPASSTPGAATEVLAQRLASPAAHAGQPWQAQSLAEGTAGIALLHIERALASVGDWSTAHRWVKAATCQGVSAADQAGLYLGVPAIAYILRVAGADGHVRYRSALARLDAHVNALAHRRADRALERITRGQLPAFAEYDLLHGLTGIGAYLLAHAPGRDALGRILAYLVRLTEPLHAAGPALPGWWTFHDPNVKTSPGFPGGHANLGIAHGITGPLALLAQAQRHGAVVDGQAEAIERICGFLDCWRQDTGTGPWWPQWITRHDLRTGRPSQPDPARPSWCYGTPGIARAQQHAAIATSDTRRQQAAEHALAACLSDPSQLRQITSPGLCHGWAGVYQTAFRAACDELTPQIRSHLPHLARLLTRHALAAQDHGSGLLEGAAGAALVLHTAARATPPISAWDTCLMLN